MDDPGSRSLVEKLRDNVEQIQERRRELDSKDRQIQQHVEAFAQSVSRRNQQATVHEEHARELADARSAHRYSLEVQQERLNTEHAQALRRHHERLEEEARRKLREHADFLETAIREPQRIYAASGEFEAGCRCEVLREVAVSELDDEADVVGHLSPGTEVTALDMSGAGRGKLKVRAQFAEGWVDAYTEEGHDILLAFVDPPALRADAPGSAIQARLWASKARLREQLVEAEGANHRFLEEAEHRAANAVEELVAAETSVRLLTQERSSEAEAAEVTNQAILAERRGAQRRGERVAAEIRSRVSEVDALKDRGRSTEARMRALQQELSKSVYTRGQKDLELKVKNSELQEVRHSVTTIQDEMDEVNQHLKEQCNRVQRVEGSLRLSRDLGEKVRSMREMVKESNSAIGQLCGLLETERARREQCTHGLRQQRVRTELLLQLLHHFKSRTQDLAPQAVLLGAGAAQSGGQYGAMNVGDSVLSGSFS